MIKENLQAIRRILGNYLGRKISQPEMARLSGVTVSGYRKWEQLGVVGVKSLFAIKEAIRVACPELPNFDMLKIEEEGFPAWLEENLKTQKERGISRSDQALGDLIKDWDVWKALGGDVRLHQALRQKLPIYREDLDKEDWISVIRLMQAGQLKEMEWQFKDPEVMARRARFKAPKGFVITDSKWAKIERIIAEEIVKMQAEEKHKREQE